MSKITKDEALKLALEALENASDIMDSWAQKRQDDAITAIREALAEECVCGEPDTPGTHRTDGPCLAEQPAPSSHLTDEQKAANGLAWLARLEAMQEEFAGLAEQPTPVAEPHEQHDCSRSHPHENMDAMCKLRTEIARLTNENARLKARHQDDEINTYRMTLLCIRDGLQQGMSKSIQKLQAREINDVLGMPSFASYRTSPSASPSQGDIKPWVGLTQQDINIAFDDTQEGGGFDDFARAIEAKLREKNEPREKNA